MKGSSSGGLGGRGCLDPVRRRWRTPLYRRENAFQQKSYAARAFSNEADIGAGPTARVPVGTVFRRPPREPQRSLFRNLEQAALVLARIRGYRPRCSARLRRSALVKKSVIDTPLTWFSPWPARDPRMLRDASKIWPNPFFLWQEFISADMARHQTKFPVLILSRHKFAPDLNFKLFL